MSLIFIVAHTTFTFSYWTASGKMFVQACCHDLQLQTNQALGLQYEGDYKGGP